MPDNATEKLTLTMGQRQNFSANLRDGAIKELRKRGLLTDHQVQKILTYVKH